MCVFNPTKNNSLSPIQSRNSNVAITYVYIGVSSDV